MRHLALFIALLAQATAAAAGDARPPASALVARLRDTPVAELERLNFVELNALKNAVYAASGYVFAEDRPWLRSVFCEEGAAPAPASAPALALARYQFPPCQEGGELDDAARKALANLRVATFRRLGGAPGAGALERAVAADFRAAGKDGKGVLAGRGVPLEAFTAWQRSLTRDLAGYRRLRQLVDQPGSFDAMELLGLYAGDVILLRALIEARHGKPLTGTLAWEAQQLLGVGEPRPDYDPARLPIEIQTKLQILDDVLQRIQRSDVNDLPPRLKGKRLDFTAPASEEETVYQGAAC